MEGLERQHRIHSRNLVDTDRKRTYLRAEFHTHLTPRLTSSHVVLQTKGYSYFTNGHDHGALRHCEHVSATASMSVLESNSVQKFTMLFHGQSCPSARSRPCAASYVSSWAPYVGETMGALPLASSENDYRSPPSPSPAQLLSQRRRNIFIGKTHHCRTINRLSMFSSA